MNTTLTSLLMYPGISLADDRDSIFKVTTARQDSYSGLKRQYISPLEDNAISLMNPAIMLLWKRVETMVLWYDFQLG